MNNEEVIKRVGEGTEFAATLVCMPYDFEIEDVYNKWQGRIRFDDDRHNIHTTLPLYDGGETAMPEDWVFYKLHDHSDVLMTHLVKWYEDIVVFVESARNGGIRPVKR